MPSPSGANTSASISLVAEGFYVEHLREPLKDESLWDQNTSRTEHPNSPHHECHDIWARYAPPSEYGLEQFSCVWYPIVETGPLHPLKATAAGVLEVAGGGELLGVLITKIPAGKSVKPHTDRGWHAECTDKYALSIEANDQQAFCFEDTELKTKPGDLFWFYNQNRHWVTNNSNEDRITAIFCIKR